MAQSPLKPCTRCGTLSKTSRCEKHPHSHVSRTPRKPDANRGNRHQRGYGNRWARFSKAYRLRHPWCRRCESMGIQRASAEVDHVMPLSAGGAQYDEANLQALCKRCHSQKTRVVDSQRFGHRGN